MVLASSELQSHLYHINFGIIMLVVMVMVACAPDHQQAESSAQ